MSTSRARPILKDAIEKVKSAIGLLKKPEVLSNLRTKGAWGPNRRAFRERTSHIQHGENGAGEGNRTLVVSLEGFCSTIELHPLEGVSPLCLVHAQGARTIWWRGLDSNQRTLSGQIYSLMDLTTLPPLHNRDFSEARQLQQ